MTSPLRCILIYSASNRQVDQVEDSAALLIFRVRKRVPKDSDSEFADHSLLSENPAGVMLVRIHINSETECCRGMTNLYLSSWSLASLLRARL